VRLLLLAAAASLVLVAGPAAVEPPGAPAQAQQPALRLALDRERFPRDRRAELSFRVLDRDGAAVRDFDVRHERRMHVIVVRRDLTGYRHIHPALGPDGRWRVPFRLRRPGPHRVFADFSTGGTAHVLAGDVSVPGRYRPRRLPPPSNAAELDGYRVSLSRTGDVVRFSVRRGGREVTDLQPYLGARGHLVALRAQDLEYLHVHPEHEATEGGGIRFAVHYPSGGRYRLFLQFRHRDRVRTVAFTQRVPPPPPPPLTNPGGEAPPPEDHDEHPH
jgi:hypothetical protein